jgi:hypothetical protein
MSYEDFQGMQLGDPDTVRRYHVYSYEHLDDLSFMRSPEHVFADDASGSLATFMAAVDARLREAGWEGDGRLEVFWLPPFADVGVEDTWGTYVWCVKQSNNGTSWMASSHPLPFKRLTRIDLSP